MKLSFFKSIENNVNLVLMKGRKALPIGTITTLRNGTKVKKVSDKKWIPVKENNTESKKRGRPKKKVESLFGDFFDEKKEKIEMAEKYSFEKGDEVLFDGKEATVTYKINVAGKMLYNIKLKDENKTKLVEGTTLTKKPLTDDKKISEAIQEATPETRTKTENEIFGGKPKTENEIEKEENKNIEETNKKSEEPIKEKMELANFGEVDVLNYTNIDVGNVGLFKKETVLEATKPIFIPLMDDDYFKWSSLSVPFDRLEDGNYIVIMRKFGAGKDYQSSFGSDDIGRNREKFIFAKMNMDQLVLTLDYYNKYTEAKHKQNFEKEYQQRINETKQLYLKTGISEKEAQETAEGIVKGRFKQTKLKKISMDKMTRASFNLIKQNYLNTHPELRGNENIIPKEWDKIVWNKYREMLKDFGYKSNDYKIMTEELNNTYSKGEETSYGDSGLKDDLLNEYGIKIKRQNGNELTQKEIDIIKGEMRAMESVFGSKKEMSKDFGLKISYAGDKLMHARKASGIFMPGYHAIGFSNGMKGMTISHEFAHFMDFYLGGKNTDTRKRFASDNWDSEAGQIARLFRSNIKNKEPGYWTRTCECFARALEMYYYKNQYGKESYNQYYGDEKNLDPNYPLAKDFDELIEPKIKNFLEVNKNILKSFTKNINLVFVK